jgi:hypothetical protein
MKSNASAPRRRESGFALLITITLLAFLVLLLVSLAALTRVETQVASNNQQVSQARQNALMALNVALGQLQLTMGPDKRVSVPASQAGDGAPVYGGADPDNNANWVGVYRQNPDPAVTTRDPQLLNWLVSGNQSLGVPPTTANNPAVVPNSAVTGLTPDMSATTAVTVGGRPAVLLVGPGTTLPESNGNTPPPPSSIDRFVVAPLEPITVPASSIPGFDPAATTPPIIGNFAYWIGDEGMKAKVSLVDPWESPSTSTLDALRTNYPGMTQAEAKTVADTYRFVNAQRSGIEGVGKNTSDAKLGEAYDATDSLFKSSLPNILSLQQFAYSNPDEQATLAVTQKIRFHDLTASSYSVIADVVKGGLKKDLTAWIADPARPSNPVSSLAVDDYITSGDPTDASKYGLPKWDLIRDYVTNTTIPRQQESHQHGVHPVITYARMAYNVTHPGTGPYRHNMMPAVVLWNPYNTDLPAGTYEVCFGYTFYDYQHNTYGGNNFLKFNSYPGTTKSEYLNVSKPQIGSMDYSKGNAYWRFKLETKGIPSGQSHIFTIKNAHNDTIYSAAASTLSDATFDPANSIYIPSTVSMAASNYASGCFINLEGFTNKAQAGHARLEVLLTKELGIGVTDQQIRDNSYHSILGMVGFWGSFTKNLKPLAPDNSAGHAHLAHAVELTMTATPLNSNNTKSGTPRWLASLNPLADTSLRYPIASGTTNTYNPSYSRDFYIASNAPTVIDRPVPIPTSDTTVSAGLDLASSGQAAILRELPKPNVPLFSLAQLQHVGTSPINLNPLYAVGNSLCNVYIAPDSTQAAPPSDTFCQSPTPQSFPSNAVFSRLYDTSYLLNKALWDEYFFSTVPAGINGLTMAQAINPDYRLPNARHVFYWNSVIPVANEITEAKTTISAASHLLVNGGFNINSTSEQAWRALLYSHNRIASDPLNSAKTHPYSRFSAVVGEPNAAWTGHRILSDAQIDALATGLVQQVRSRGPFLSLSSFVNRSLSGNSDGFKGAIQAVIDSTSGSLGAINDTDPFFDAGAVMHPATAYPLDITTNQQKRVYDGGESNANSPAVSRGAFAPGYLTQADILTAIGPALTARSDTFRIRTYGETLNPVTNTLEGRAWCEAIVQRVPEYMDAGNAASTPENTLNSTNARFGRRFKIISFQWLSPNDI